MNTLFLYKDKYMYNINYAKKHMINNDILSVVAEIQGNYMLCKEYKRIKLQINLDFGNE